MSENEKFLARSWYILLFILSTGVAVVMYALWTSVVPEENRDQAFVLIGVLVTKFSDTIAWRVNSSKGSSDKWIAASQGAPIIKPEEIK